MRCFDVGLTIWAGKMFGLALLLDNESDVNRTDDDGWDVLIRASSNGHHACVEMLLDKHSDVNRVNTDGLTALKATTAV